MILHSEPGRPRPRVGATRRFPLHYRSPRRRSSRHLAQFLNLAAASDMGENVGLGCGFHVLLDGPRRAMFSDQIETMKRQFTDKYVLVDETRPELARFRNVVGRVKTVNMSGRALV